MNNIPEIKLYGAEGCHKTNYYKSVLKETGLLYKFLDVETNEDHAEELRGLYENRKLNFPTITIGNKKLRNPYKEDLHKWLDKLIPSRLPIVHHREGHKFSMDINGEEAKVEYDLRDGTMYLVHSEVPCNLRDQGIGKVLVEKTFEKLTEEGSRAIAVCSFIKTVANRNEKWNSVIGPCNEK